MKGSLQAISDFKSKCKLFAKTIIYRNNNNNFLYFRYFFYIISLRKACQYIYEVTKFKTDHKCSKINVIKNIHILQKRIYQLFKF